MQAYATALVSVWLAWICADNSDVVCAVVGGIHCTDSATGGSTNYPSLWHYPKYDCSNSAYAGID